MHLPLPRLLWVLTLTSALMAPAKIEEWKDVQGNAFKAEPSEAFGPFALFRTSTGAGRRLPWRALPMPECVRFAEQAGRKPDPAARWIDANGQLTGRLRGYLRTHQDVNLVTADLNSVSEPQLLIVFYVDNSASGSWDMVGKSIAPYQALLKKYPGQVAGIQYGVNHGEKEHRDMGLRPNVPWLLVDHAEQRRITSLYRLAPGRSEFAILMLSRDGVPIFAANNPDETAVNQFFVDADALLGLLRPDNPLSWPDRAHFIAAQHAAQHKQDSAGPVLVGDPLMPQGLKERGISRVAAQIEVGVDGKPTAVTLKEDDSIPAAMVPALTKALQRSALFAPAVHHGEFVAGTYEYLKVIPR